MVVFNPSDGEAVCRVTWAFLEHEEWNLEHRSKSGAPEFPSCPKQRFAKLDVTAFSRWMEEVLA